MLVVVLLYIDYNVKWFCFCTVNPVDSGLMYRFTKALPWLLNVTDELWQTGV